VKRLKLVALALALVLAMAGNAIADTVNVYENNQLVKSVVFKIDVPYYVVNNQPPGMQMDVAPFIQDGRTYVPVRFLGNSLGVNDSNIVWDDGTQTATLKGTATLQMTIGKAQIISNGQAKTIDVAPALKSDRTFLPARFVAEGLGYQVEWDEITQTVVCWPAGQTKPDVSAAVGYITQMQQPEQEEIYTLNEYQIPTETKLNVEKKYLNPANQCELQFNIDLTKGNLESQWNDAAAILSQKIDSQVVDEIMAYVKQKTDWKQGLGFKAWESNEKKVGISSMGGSDGIQITVWYK